MTDVGKYLLCRVTATNPTGSAQAFSNVVGPVTAVAAFSTWSTTDKYETAAGLLDLTNSNRTVTGHFVSGYPTCKIRGSASQSAGKKYFEMTLNTMPTNTGTVGICDATHVLSSSVYPGEGDSTGVIFTSVNPDRLQFDSSVGQYIFTAGSITAAVGSVFGWAVDFDAAGGTLWFRHNGVWLRGDPVAGTDGCIWGAGPADALFPFLTNISTVASDFSVTLNVGNAAFAATIPSGFTAWG